MNRIRDCTTEEIRCGVMRCHARMAGVMPMGVLDGETVKDAPGQYRAELERRGEKELNLLLRPDK